MCSDFPIRQSFADAKNSQDENSHGEDDTCPNCAERGETESEFVCCSEVLVIVKVMVMDGEREDKGDGEGETEDADEDDSEDEGEGEGEGEDCGDRVVMGNLMLPIPTSLSGLGQLKFLYRMKFEVADHTGKMTVLLGDKYAVCL